MKLIIDAGLLILSITTLASSQVIRDRGILRSTPKSARIQVAKISEKNGGLLEQARVLVAEYSFDTKGSLTDSAIYNFDGSLYAKYAAVYDDKRRKKEEVYYNSKNKLVDKMLYNYDAGGKLIEKVVEKSKTSPKLTITFNYDNHGNISEKLHPSTKDNPGHKLVYSYDEPGRKIDRSYYDAKGNPTARISTTYDAQGRLMTMYDEFSKPSSGNWKLELTYDGKGNVSEETLQILDGTSKWRYQYEFDGEGNWTKRTKLSLIDVKGSLSFTPVEVAYRTIMYHPKEDAFRASDRAFLGSIVEEEEMSSYLQGDVIKKVEPPYPQQAKRMNMQGEVIVLTLSDEKGEVVSVRAFPAAPALLRNASEAAAWHWKLNPIVSGGYSVRSVGTFRFNFNL